MYSRETLRVLSRNSPSLSFMMLALWIAVTASRPVRARVLERELRNPRRRLLGDDLDALHDARDDLVLEPGVQVFGVLADDDDVDVGEAALHARQIADRPQVRVEIQRLAQPDVDAREALRDRRCHRPLQRNPVRPDRVEQRHGQRLVVPLERIHPRFVAVPLDVDRRGLEDPHDRRRTSGPMPSPGMSVMMWDMSLRTCPIDRASSRGAMSAATPSSSSRSAAPNAARRSLSMSISPSTRSPCMIGTTISDWVSMLQARYRGSAFTSSTMSVAFRCRGSAADALAKRDAGVRRRFAEERPEHELVPFEQVDSDPGVLRDRVLQYGDGSREDAAGSGLRVCLPADAVEDAGVCRGSHRGESFNSRKSRRRPPNTGTINSPVEVA